MKKANPKVIGAFVVGAVAILIAGLLAFGSGKAFEDQVPVVMLFEESLAGLSVGSPITFNGVAIGEVTEIRVEYNLETLESRIPVFGILIPDRLRRIGDSAGGQRGAALIEKGFRAQLVSQSLVTGQLGVELSFRPETEARLSGIDYGAQEIPTIKSGLESLKETLSELPLQKLLGSAVTLLDDLSAAIASPEFDQSLSSLSAGLQSFEQTMARIDAGAQPIVTDVQAAAADARDAVAAGKQAVVRIQADVENLGADLDATLAKLRALLENLDRQVVPLSESIQNAAGSMETTFDNANSMIESNSSMRRDLEVAIRNIGAAAKAVKGLSEELERNPETLVRGRR
jgi:paraquat-inducible protein B